jgi:hypothetical protein
MSQSKAVVCAIAKELLLLTGVVLITIKASSKLYERQLKREEAVKQKIKRDIINPPRSKVITVYKQS